MNPLTNKVYDLANPLAEELGYDLVEVEYTKEGKNWFLRFYIDKPEGVSLDDCVEFSEQVGDLLDQEDEDFIPNAYYLEVSSIGAERPLKSEEDFQRAVGKYIQVTLHQAMEAESIFEGHLVDLSEDTLTLTYRVKTREKTLEIPRSNIAKARLAVKL